MSNTPGAVRAAEKIKSGAWPLNEAAQIIDEETGLKELIEAAEMSMAWLKEFGMDERGAVLTTLEAAIRRGKGGS